MKIIKSQQILQRQSENYVKGELSNVASVLQVPQILVTYYSIDADSSPTMPGFKNVEDYVGPNSTLQFNKIEQFPMSGIDTLVEQSTFDEEVGYDEDFSSQGIIFPNTVVPKPNDMFIIPNSQVPALYIVTNTSPVTVRTNPFVEVQFRLLSRNPETIKELEKQVKTNYLTTVTAIGMDKTLIIEKESFFEVEKHVKNYLDIIEMYRTLFWDDTRSAFIFDGCYDEKEDKKYIFLDLILWKLMFDEGIVIYDDVVTYANNNFQKTVPRIYTSSPHIYVDEHLYKKSILYRLLTKAKNFAEFKFPQSYLPDPRIGKFTGTNLIYFEQYGDHCDCNIMCMQCPVWDEEFVARIRDGATYPEELNQATICDGCSKHCQGKKTVPFNVSLRNVIINWYNGKEIDWDNITLVDEKSSENYFLIPLVLAAYKHYIHDLQK